MSLTGATNAGAAIATLQPNTAGQLVNLGGADAAGTLGLTDAELDTVTAGTLRVGRNKVATSRSPPPSIRPTPPRPP